MSYTTRNVRKHNVACFVMAVVCMLSYLFLARPTLVIGESMEPTLKSGQFVVCMPRVINPFLKLQRGDVVLVHSEQRGAVLVKRMIGFPGDTVEICNNRVFVNGKAICEQYLGEPMVTPDVAPFILEEDQYYLLGDNRNVSADSRRYGTFSGFDIKAIVYVEQQAILLPVVIILIGGAILFGCVLPEWELPGSDPKEPTDDAA